MNERKPGAMQKKIEMLEGSDCKTETVLLTRVFSKQLYRVFRFFAVSQVRG